MPQPPAHSLSRKICSNVSQIILPSLRGRQAKTAAPGTIGLLFFRLSIRERRSLAAFFPSFAGRSAKAWGQQGHVRALSLPKHLSMVHRGSRLPPQPPANPAGAVSFHPKRQANSQLPKQSFKQDLLGWLLSAEKLPAGALCQTPRESFICSHFLSLSPSSSPSVPPLPRPLPLVC